MAFNLDKQRRVGHGNIHQALRLLRPVWPQVMLFLCP